MARVRPATPGMHTAEDVALQAAAYVRACMRAAPSVFVPVCVCVRLAWNLVTLAPTSVTTPTIS